jgi:hypothetical protein
VFNDKTKGELNSSFKKTLIFLKKDGGFLSLS